MIKKMKKPKQQSALNSFLEKADMPQTAPVKKLTQAAKRNYIDSPRHCPYCESNNLSFGSFEAEETVATSQVSCQDCGRSWTDVYRLKDIYENPE